MYKLCKTEESTARQKGLEKGLMELMHQMRFEEITVSSLCKHVGVPRNSFYRYFSTKEDTLIALIDHMLMDSNEYFMRNWNGGPHLELVDMELVFSYWLQQRDFLDAIVKNGRSMLLIERSIHMHEQKQAQERTVFDAAGFAKEQTRYIVNYGMMSTLLRWYQYGYPAAPEEMAKVAYELFSFQNILMKDMLL